MFGALLPLLPSVIGAVGSLLSGHQAQEGAREQQATSAAMAREQMDFQERMANTAEQRKVADLKAAGLNPNLAYGNVPAATPSGAMGQAQNVKGAGVNSAMAAMQALQGIAQTKAQLAVAQSQVKLNDAAAQQQFWLGQEAAKRQQLFYDTGEQGKDGSSFALAERQLMLQQLRAGLGLTAAQTRASSARSALDEYEAPQAALKARGFQSLNKLAFPMFNSADSAAKAARRLFF